MAHLKQKALDVLLPPTPPLDKCWKDISTHRNYGHISIDLWRSDYDLNDEGSKKVGDFCIAYSTVWIARSLAGLVPFPRKGIGYSPNPKTHVGMTVHKDDVEWVARHLWRLLTDKKHLVRLRLDA